MLGDNQKQSVVTKVFVLPSDPLLHVAPGELGPLLVLGEVQPGGQRPPPRLAEEAHAAGS